MMLSMDMGVRMEGQEEALATPLEKSVYAHAYGHP